MNEYLFNIAQHVWENRNLGEHACIPLGESYITMEVFGDEDNEDYLIVAFVDDVDDLGYPLTEYIDYLIMDKSDFEGEDEE